MPDTTPPAEVTLTDLRIILERVAGDVRAVLGRLDRTDETQRDHEDRLREMERHGCATHENRLQVLEKLAANAPGPDHETRLRAVERRLWSIPGAGILVAVAGLVVSIWAKVS